MHFNIFFTLKGPGGKIDAPNNSNPVECKDLYTLLHDLAEQLPNNWLVETIGVRIEKTGGTW